MSEISLDIQRAVIAALKADTALSGMVGDRVFDSPPHSAVVPYVRLDGWRQTITGADCYDISVVSFDAVAFATGSRGRVPVAEIAGAVKDALHRADLEIETGIEAEIRCSFVEYFDEEDENVRSVILKFTVTSYQF